MELLYISSVTYFSYIELHAEKRTSKRHSDNSKEPKISEPVVKPARYFALCFINFARIENVNSLNVINSIQVVEVRQKPSTPETIDYSLIAPPIPAQDEIVLFETEETLEE